MMIKTIIVGIIALFVAFAVFRKIYKDYKKNNISKQINKEVLITIGLYLLYFVWWYYFAYEYSSDNVEEYKYILGLPEWFFYSCVVGLILVNILVYICVKFFFKEIDFEKYNKTNHLEENKESLNG